MYNDKAGPQAFNDNGKGRAVGRASAYLKSAGQAREKGGPSSRKAKRARALRMTTRHV